MRRPIPCGWRRVLVTAALCLPAATVWARAPAAAPAAPAPPPPPGPEQAARVLPPEAAPRIEAAFALAAPTWRLDSASIDRDHVKARVCAGEVCHDLVLSDVKAACAGKRVGAFCLRWAAAPPAGTAPLLAALAQTRAATMWQTIPARPEQPAIVAPPEAPTQLTAVAAPAPATAAGAVAAVAAITPTAPSPPQPASPSAAGDPDRGQAPEAIDVPSDPPPAAASASSWPWLWLSLAVAVVAFAVLWRRGAGSGGDG